MMSRRANPSARRMTTALTASPGLVVPAGVDPPRSGTPVAGPVNEIGLLHER